MQNYRIQFVWKSEIEYNSFGNRKSKQFSNPNKNLIHTENDEFAHNIKLEFWFPLGKYASKQVKHK